MKINRKSTEDVFFFLNELSPYALDMLFLNLFSNFL